MELRERSIWRSQRPIVEFSLEDKRKLKIKEMRKQQGTHQFKKAPESQEDRWSGGGQGKHKQQNQPKQPQQQQQQNKQSPHQPQQQPKQSPHQQHQKPKQSPQQQHQKPKQSPQQQHQKPKQSPQQDRQQQQQQRWPQKRKGPGQEVDTFSHYSGFRTKPEVEQVELADGKKRRKVLPLPSKRGPKIRQRDKGKRLPVQPKTVKKGPTRKEQQTVRSLELGSQSKKQNAKAGKRFVRNREDDRFESLVQQYKRKLMGTSAKAPVIKKSKWFSS